MAKFIRRMFCAAATILLIVALGTVCFAVGDQETVCYEHGDVDGDGKVTNTDAIYIMYNYMFGDERFPINQEWDFDGDSNTDNKDAVYIMYHFMFDDLEDYKLNGTIHSYYAPTWTWDETAHTAEVTFKCGCGKTDTYTTGNRVTVAPGAVEEATCVQAGLETYVASVVVDGKTYTNTYEKVLPAGVGHQMDGTPDCENGSDCLLCDYSLPKLGHNMTPVEDVAATCTVNAYTTYECSNSGCGHTETVVQQETAGHSLRYDKDVQNGCKFTKWYACDKCDYTATGETDSDVYYNHTYTATLTQDATCVSEGVKTYACQCGVSYTEEIPINDSHAWVAGERWTVLLPIPVSCATIQTAGKIPATRPIR